MQYILKMPNLAQKSIIMKVSLTHHKQIKVQKNKELV